MTVQMYIATAAWLLLVAGWLERKHRVRHVRLMSSGIALDVLLVLYLELTRGAVGKALSFELELFQQTHIALSSAALVLYFPTVVLGIKLWLRKATPRQRTLHVWIATAALVFRTFGWLFMFSMLG